MRTGYKAKDILERLNGAFSAGFAGSIFGFDLAWLLMKIPYIDMRMNTGLMIPAGFALGVLIGAFARRRAGKSAKLALASALVAVTAAAAASMLADLEGAYVVAPILVREGLNARFVDLAAVRLAMAIYIALGVASFGWKALLRKLEGRSYGDGDSSGPQRI